MPSALSHDPAITVPGASTDNAIVIFDGTGGTGFGNSTILVDSGGNGRIGIATDTNIITLTNETVAVAGAITGVTALTVDNININGNTISSTAGTDLLITPLAGQQLILDGTIIIDAGVVTAATSITSTEFVGGGVGITALVAGNITAGGTFLAQDGSALTALNGTQVTTGTVAAARLDLSAKANLASPVFTTSIRITPQSSAPGSPATGTIYYDTEDNIAYVYNGTSWMALNSAPPFTATGGTVDTSVSGYRIHTFTADGSFVATGSTGTVEYLVIGGGGGGGQYGGGGAGGHRTATGLSVAVGTHAIVVGDGGAGTSGTGEAGRGGDGDTSSIGSLISVTGGGGGGGQGTGYWNGRGTTDGSGGGGGGDRTGSTSPGGAAGTYGSAGGIGAAEAHPNYAGAGGGGAGATGGNAGTGNSVGGAGGAGTASSITGSSVTRAGGGGGTGYNWPSGGTGGAAGSGGGGKGGSFPDDDSDAAAVGVANTGGGGGSGDGETTNEAGHVGGSGIVIIKYAV